MLDEFYTPQNINLAKLELEKTWKPHVTWAKTRNTPTKFELDTCSNSTVWNSMKLEIDKKTARSGTIKMGSFLSWHKCYLYSAKSLTNDVQVDHGVGQQMWNSHLDYLDLSCWSIQLMEHDPINCRMTHLIRLASWEAKHKTEYSVSCLWLISWVKSAGTET